MTGARGSRPRPPACFSLISGWSPRTAGYIVQVVLNSWQSTCPSPGAGIISVCHLTWLSPGFSYGCRIVGGPRTEKLWLAMTGSLLWGQEWRGLEEQPSSPLPEQGLCGSPFSISQTRWELTRLRPVRQPQAGRRLAQRSTRLQCVSR